MPPATRPFRQRGATIAGALALLTLPPGALADGEAFEFRVSNALSPQDPSATVEVWAHFDRQDHAFQGARFDVRAAEAGWIDGTQIEMGHGFGIGARPGDIVGPDVLGIIVGQLAWPLGADPSNPILVWSAEFEASDFSPREIGLASRTTAFRVFPSATLPFTTEPRLETFVEGAGTIVVIPAPGALIALVGAGLVAMRRRAR